MTALKDPETRATQAGNKPRHRESSRLAMVPKSTPMGESPTWLTADQRRMWREVVGFVDPGLLLSSDRPRFIQLVVLLTAERAMLREWNDAGSPHMVPGKRGGKPTRDPIYAELRLLRNDLSPLCHEFGLSPLARSRVKVHREAEDNPLSKFLKGL